MYLIAIGWAYVVLMMALAEALSAQGTVLGALMTLLFYGALPLALVLYLMNTPHRRRARAREASVSEPIAADSGDRPDQRGEAPADAVAPVREEP